jgi:exonuclease SbcC
MASARQEVATLGATVEAHQRNAADASRDAADAEGVVRSLSSKNGWVHVTSALDRGPGVATILRNDLETARQEADSTNQSIGSAQTRIKQIDANITLADRLREDEQSHRQQASLARDLASMLRTDQFPAFIRDSVMSTLAANGSAWLRKVSGERYDLKVDGQDFEVADLWNAGEERGVRTLSGGETFLASLALALALAELLPKMSGQDGEGALQSLFIDEGFSNLDEETLKTVSDAIEVLGQDRSRLIALVTHLPALAERMPARIVVHKTQTGSTVTVE